MELTEKIVKNLFKSHFFRRGQRYYKEGRVKQLKYDDIDDSWRAQVVGSKVYNTTISISNNGISNYCTCPAFSTYGQCKHTCATLLALAENNQKPLSSSSPSKNEDTDLRYSQAEDLLQKFSQLKSPVEQDNHLSKEQLQVEFTLHTGQNQFYYRNNNVFEISLKIGTNRLYVVKEINNFMVHLTQGLEMYFGKNFIYDPNLHYFRENDNEILRSLVEIWKTERFYKSSMYDSSFANSSSKHMPLPAYAVDDLLPKLQNANCKYIQGTSKYNQLTLNTDGLPFNFSLEPNDNSNEDYRLKVAGLNDGVLFSLYGYYGYHGTLYKVSKTEEEMILPLLENTNIDGTIDVPVSKQQTEKFVTESMPQMQTLGKVTLPETVEEKLVSPPLNIKAYIEKNEASFQIRIIYDYGFIEINPFNEAGKPTLENNKILIRDVKAEDQFMSILESSSLKIKHHQLHADDVDTQFEFLYETLPLLEEYADIYMTSAVRSMIISEPPNSQVTVEASADTGYLEIGFQVDDILPDEVSNLLQSVREKKKYHRLPDGTFIPLNDETLSDMAELQYEFSDLSDTSGDTIQLPMYRGLQVEDQISKSSEITTSFNHDFKALYQSVNSPQDEEIFIPEKLNADLRDYQETGYKWLKSLSKYNLGGILADDMGLGKTLQCIAYLLSEKEDAASQPFLIVAPASLVYNWKNEFEKFAPSMTVQVISGSIAERRKVMASDIVPDVYITSYHTLRQDIEWYQEKVFHTLILDEAQAIKNYQTKIAKAVRKIAAPKRFALSGTPIENSQEELWSIFQALMPGFLYDHKTFRSMEPKDISRVVRPFILRRLKEDVLTELPDKIENVYYSDLNKDQKQLYLAYLERIQKEASESLETEGLAKGRIKILAGLTRLRQLCCHPSLFVENYSGGSGKLDTLFEVIQNAEESNQRILLFSQFPSMLRIIHQKLIKAGKSAYYLDGQTPSKKRVELVESFNHGEENIFLISLKAGGTGLNLTGADTVILYDLWWNPAIEEQAIGRAHRIGQKKVVQVIRLIAQGTIEEKINKLQQQKKEMIDQIIQPGETSLSSMSEEDIREILSI